MSLVNITFTLNLSWMKLNFC